MRFDIPPKPWDDLNIYELADILHCSPDSHRDYIIKRVRLLREQGKDDFANLVEQSFDLSDEAMARYEAFTNTLTAMFDRLNTGS